MITLRSMSLFCCCGLVLSALQTSALAGSEGAADPHPARPSVEQITLGPSKIFHGYVPKTVMVPPIVRPFSGYEAWMLVEPLTYTIGGTQLSITVPKGFVTDYASVPRALWSVFPKQGVYSEAAIVHDYLYWVQMCSKEQADNIFLIAMKEHDTGFVTRWSMYEGVSKGGQSSWDENRKKRDNGGIRTVPEKYWPEIRTQGFDAVYRMLQLYGVEDHYPQIPADVCRLGDSAVVP
jgi:Protein of unknown function (DUF1353).